MKQRVAVYARVSTDREEQAQSLESQRQYFAAYIQAHPEMELTEVFYDEGLSGTATAHREGFHRMIRAARSGKMDLILTKEVSRFARNTVDTLQYVRLLKSLQVGVLFMNDGIHTLDSEGEFRLTMMASISQEESRKTSDRVKWGQTRRMEQGVVFGRDLLGYAVRNGTLLLLEEEALLVRRIFHMFAVQGKGSSTIARELNAAGECTKHGGSWTNVAVLRILRNEKYVGDLCQKKTITPDFLTHQKRPNHGEEPLICLTDHHPPIIDRTLWQRTQERLQQSGRGGGSSNRYWCSGKVVCGWCGSVYVSRVRKQKNGDTVQFWRCREAAAHGRRKQNAQGAWCGCDAPAVKDTVLRAGMAAVLRQLQPMYGSYPAERFGQAHRTMQAEQKRQLAMLRKKRACVIDLMLEGVIDRAELAQRLEQYDTRIQALTQEPHDSDDERQEEMWMQQVMERVGSILEDPVAAPVFCREVLDQIRIEPDETGKGRRVVYVMKGASSGTEAVTV